VLGAFVTAVYVLRASKIIFWGPRPAGEVLHLSDPRRTEWAAPLVLCACLVVFGLWPRLLLDAIDATTSGYLNRVALVAEALRR